MVALKALLWWNDSRPRLGVEADKSPEKVPVLGADTMNVVLLPWIKEPWEEVMKSREGNAHQYSPGLRECS